MPTDGDSLIVFRYTAGGFVPVMIPDDTLEDEVRRFYELFYHHTLTPAQLEAVLSGARGLGR